MKKYIILLFYWLGCLEGVLTHPFLYDVSIYGKIKYNLDKYGIIQNSIDEDLLFV
ncbi:hypothetical protein [Cochleicola gelatinilyticus]|uniref:hypothetical protein n=1 Tax=Cochleicola gelatinilyticus TaxID=1763537 RepID=UPI0012F985BA|nr:hypothetical protein [Cochleicola gelatinilyticus]